MDSTNVKGSHWAQPVDYILIWCRIINVLAGSSAFLCLVAHGMCLVVGPHLFALHDDSLLQILRLYSILIACILILVETEWTWFLGQALILQSYLGRAFLQGLLAVLTLELATSQALDEKNDFQRSIRIYRKVSSYLMLACAGYYLLGGLICIGALRRARFQKFHERQRLQRELEEMERATGELKSLLASHSKETA